MLITSGEGETRTSNDSPLVDLTKFESVIPKESTNVVLPINITNKMDPNNIKQFDFLCIIMKIYLVTEYMYLFIYLIINKTAINYTIS